MNYTPRPLPEDAQRLCTDLAVPVRLLAHLTLVHDVAIDLVEGLRRKFPDLIFDGDAVCFGAASHDMGKLKYPNELSGPGHQHEEDGPVLLEEHGVEPSLARFARTHGSWSHEELQLEDLLVALCDCVWKGERLGELERQVIFQIATQAGHEEWEVFSELDGLLDKIGSQGGERLAWQRTNG
jgi:hypothetical protein